MLSPGKQGILNSNNYLTPELWLLIGLIPWDPLHLLAGGDPEQTHWRNLTWRQEGRVLEEIFLVDSSSMFKIHFSGIENNGEEVPLVVQCAKDPTTSLLWPESLIWLEFSPWPQNFWMSGTAPPIKKKGKKKRKKETEKQDLAKVPNCLNVWVQKALNFFFFTCLMKGDR